MNISARGSYCLQKTFLKRAVLRRIYGSRNNIWTSAISVQNQKSSFLSQDYDCTSAWEKRLESPLVRKINLEEFFQQIDKKYQSEKVISAIDVDLFVNKASEVEDLDDVEELTFRLRKSPATSKTLPSTSHAIIRTFLELNKTDDLMRMLNDRLNYGLFLDVYTSNLLMNAFLKNENYRDAAKIASFLMLQEDFGSSSTSSTKFFALLSCLKYLQNPTPEPWDPFDVVVNASAAAAPKAKKKQEEERIRMKVQRNVFFDDHFDITAPQSIIGKTLAFLSFDISEDKCLKSSVEILGWALFDKWNKVESVFKKMKDENLAVALSVVEKVTELANTRHEEIESTKVNPRPKLKAIPGGNLDPEEVDELFTKLKWDENYTSLPNVRTLLAEGKTKTVNVNLISKTEELLSTSISANEKNEIDLQIQNYKYWEELRQSELQKQIQRMKDVQTLLEIQSTKKELSEREEVIFFFDNEEQWMMRQPPPPPPVEAQVEIDTSRKGKAKKIVDDENYVPPEVHTFADPAKPWTPTSGPKVHSKKKK